MWFNGIISFLLRSPLHGFVSRNTMLITVRGRKSGRPVTTPVNYVRSNGDLLSISLRSRTWWRNLRGRPTSVDVRLAGRDRRAVAGVEEAAPAVADGLGELVAHAPSVARPLGIRLEHGQPVRADLTRAARDRVIVRTRLED